MNIEEERKIEEIKNRIEELREHQTMWARSGGVGGKMALKAESEIAELKKTIVRIKNGTQDEYERLLREKEKIRFNIIKKKLIEKKLEELDSNRKRVK